MGAPTKEELLGGAPAANFAIQYDEYGNPITPSNQSAPAPIVGAQTGVSSFQYDPNAAMTSGPNLAQGSGNGQLSAAGAAELERRLNALPSWAREQARAGIFAEISKKPEYLQRNVQQPSAGGGSQTPGSQVGTQAAYQALNMLSPIAQQGFTAADMQGINAAGNAAALQSQAMIQSLAQQAAMRGQAGGGIGQVQQASAAQQGANQGMQRGTGIAMAANDRRMNAIGDMAQLGMGLDQNAFQHQLADTDLAKYLSSQAGQASMNAYQGRRQQNQDDDVFANYIMPMIGTATSMAGGGR
jgi:hypothetical protein